MPYYVQKLDNDPIIIFRHEPGSNMVAEIPASMRAAAEALSAQPEPIYLILDLTGVVLRLDDMIKTSNDATRGPGALLHHPNVIQTLFVVTDEMMRLSIHGLRNEVFGSARVAAFGSLNQALDFCYERIAEQAGR